MGGADRYVSITEHRSSRYPFGLFTPGSFEQGLKGSVFIGLFGGVNFLACTQGYTAEITPVLITSRP